MKFDLSFWKNASPIRKRIYFIVFIFIVAVLVTAIGSYIPLSTQDATTITQQVNATLNEHKASDTLTTYIFLNNFEICLVMFIPVAGAALGLFILFDTGIALGAIATTQGYPIWLGLASLVVTPVFWLEFAAYSIAMAESIWLFRRLTQKRWRELKWTGMFIGVCAGLLAVGAVVEVWLITIAG
jgi:uncharacterized membrane protein SpoIIM required for sporulation